MSAERGGAGKRAGRVFRLRLRITGESDDRDTGAEHFSGRAVRVVQRRVKEHVCEAFGGKPLVDRGQLGEVHAVTEGACCAANVPDGGRLILPLKHQHDSFVNSSKHLLPRFKGRWVQLECAVEIPKHKLVVADSNALQRELPLLF